MADGKAAASNTRAMINSCNFLFISALPGLARCQDVSGFKARFLFICVMLKQSIIVSLFNLSQAILV
jgi:hypothetical protein